MEVVGMRRFQCKWVRRLILVPLFFKVPSGRQIFAFFFALACPTPTDAVARSDVEAATLAPSGSPPITRTIFPTCRAHYPGGLSGCVCRLLPRITRPSPNGRRVGIRIVTFEACSGFTPLRPIGLLSRPEATFVTRLQPMRLPAQAARQLPDQSTTLRVDTSSTDDSRLRGALPKADSCNAAKWCTDFNV